LPSAAAARSSTNDSTSHTITSTCWESCISSGSCRHRSGDCGGCRYGGSTGGLPLLGLFVLAFFLARLQILCTVEIETLTCSAMSGCHIWHAAHRQESPRRVGVMVGPACNLLVLHHRSACDSGSFSYLMSLWLAATDVCVNVFSSAQPHLPFLSHRLFLYSLWYILKFYLVMSWRPNTINSAALLSTHGQKIH